MQHNDWRKLRDLQGNVYWQRINCQLELHCDVRIVRVNTINYTVLVNGNAVALRSSLLEAKREVNRQFQLRSN